MTPTIGTIDFGDGIQRPVVRTIRQAVEGGYTVEEIVVGRYAGQVQDGTTLSVFVIEYPSGARGAQLYPTLAEALAETREDAP